MRISNMMGYLRSQKSTEAYNAFLLKNPSLSEILRHENTVQEINQGNSNLIKYIKPEMIETLLNYISQEPHPEATFEETYKFPSVSSAFFCSEFTNLLIIFFEDVSFLEKLLSVLNTDEGLLPVLVGYFSKACDTLLSINPFQFLHFFYSQHYHERIVYHLNSSNFVELFVKILGYTENFEEFDEYLCNSITMLIETINKSQNLIHQIQSEKVLIKYIQNPNTGVEKNKRTKPFSNFYLEDMGSGEILKRNFAKLFTNPQILADLFEIHHTDITSLNKAKMSVLLSILVKFSSNYEMNSEFFFNLLDCFEKNLGELRVVLCSNQDTFTEDKAIVIDIVKVLSTVDFPKIHEKIVSLQILQKITETFEKFPFCSVLHNGFLTLISTILMSKKEILKENLIHSIKIAEIIVKNANFPMVKSKNCWNRKGFMGHLHTIANHLLKIEDENIDIRDTLDNTEGWFEFVTNVLLKQNYIESKQLGGENFENFFEKSSDEGENFENYQEIVEIKEENDKNGEKKIFDEEQFWDLGYWSLPISQETIEDI